MSQQQPQRRALVVFPATLYLLAALVVAITTTSSRPLSWLVLAQGDGSDNISCDSSEGDQQVGVYGYRDPLCSDLMHGDYLGCFNNDLCRHCQLFETEFSAHLHPCPSSVSGGSSSGSDQGSQTTTNSPSTTPTPATTPTYIPADTTAPTYRPRSDVPTNTNNPSTTTTMSSSTGSSSSTADDVLFFDDFEVFDLSQYQHENTLAGGGNWEFQLYRNNRTNSYVRDGKLHIRPTLTEEWVPDLGAVSMYGLTRESDCTSHFDYGCQRQQANPISSARINTRTFSFTTGRLEVRAKLPRGDWLWPAIWLLPKYEQYGMWPASGEIDVLEATGNAPGYAGTRGVDSMLSGLHWGLNFAENKMDLTMTSYTLPSGDFSQEFHTFGLVRTETGLYTYVDDDSNRVLEVDWSDGTSFFERGGWDANHWDNPWEGRGPGAPFDQEFYLTINLAVGGTSFFPEGNGKPWSDTSTTASQDFWAAKDQWYPSWQENDPTFQIDWIKVTAL